MLTSAAVAEAATAYDMAARRFRNGTAPAEEMHAAYDAMVAAAYQNMNEAYAALQATPADTGAYGAHAVAAARYAAAVKDAEQVLR